MPGAGAVPWLDAARALAQGVATDGGVEANIDPLQRIKLEELARVVELHVEQATGLSISSGGAYSFVPVGRGAWADRALQGWRPFLDGMVRTMGELRCRPSKGRPVTRTSTTGCRRLAGPIRLDDGAHHAGPAVRIGHWPPRPPGPRPVRADRPLAA